MPDDARFRPLAAAAAAPGAIAPRLGREALRPLASIARRATTVAMQMLAVAIIVFAVLRIIPADPLALMLPPNATVADAERMRHAFGLDRSIPEQFMIWLEHALHGDLGT